MYLTNGIIMHNNFPLSVVNRSIFLASSVYKFIIIVITLHLV